MLYWFTGSITSSFWLYYFRRSADEEDQKQAKFLDEAVFQQPVSVAFGKYEIHWVSTCMNYRAQRLMTHATATEAQFHCASTERA